MEKDTRDNYPNSAIKDKQFVSDITVSAQLGRTGFLCLKTEKIVQAICVLTDRISAGDSVHDRLRATAVALLSDTFTACAEIGGVSAVERIKIVSHIDLLSALFSVSVELPTELSMVLRRELGSLRELLFAEPKLSSLYQVSFPADYFTSAGSMFEGSAGTMMLATSQQAPVGAQSSIGHFQGQHLSPSRTRLVRSPLDVRGGGEKQPSSSPKINPKSSDRTSSILARMQPGQAYSIKDIVVAVPGVSEKTVQRELGALVMAGRLTKEGERRWSRYRLKT